MDMHVSHISSAKQSAVARPSSMVDTTIEVSVNGVDIVNVPIAFILVSCELEVDKSKLRSARSTFQQCYR
jgi:hypothetical protein